MHKSQNKKKKQQEILELNSITYDILPAGEMVALRLGVAALLLVVFLFEFIFIYSLWL